MDADPKPINDDNIRRLVYQFSEGVTEAQPINPNHVRGLIARLRAAEAERDWYADPKIDHLRDGPALGWTCCPHPSDQSTTGGLCDCCGMPATGDPDEVTDLAGLRVVLATEGDIARVGGEWVGLTEGWGEPVRSGGRPYWPPEIHPRYRTVPMPAVPTQERDPAE